MNPQFIDYDQLFGNLHLFFICFAGAAHLLRSIPARGPLANRYLAEPAEHDRAGDKNRRQTPATCGESKTRRRTVMIEETQRMKLRGEQRDGLPGLVTGSA